MLFTEIDDGLVNACVAAIGNRRFGVFLLTIRAPHLA
ncbi:Uncharacterised protein [Vibrio cholerae]|nr:Uncharacterised protein [Vibrio cholerae]